MSSPTFCEKHGRQWTAHVCPHIVEAQRANRPCEKIERREYWAEGVPEFPLWAAWFCLACISAHHLPASDTIVFEDLDGLMGDLCQPMCCECFRLWRNRIS